jgi:hypothetical protein
MLDRRRRTFFHCGGGRASIQSGIDPALIPSARVDAHIGSRDRPRG